MHPQRSVAASLLELEGLPASDITDAHMDHFFLAGSEESPTGLIGPEIFGTDALLRSLVVVAAWRSEGIGKALVREAEFHARTCGVHSVFLLTKTAETFFSRHGYVHIARENAPAAIKSTREFADICPVSSACMVKHLQLR
jgi:amino-acid N-acetyltransferase